jgi:hypothetical protein
MDAFAGPALSVDRTTTVTAVGQSGSVNRGSRVVIPSTLLCHPAIRAFQKDCS